MERNDYPFAIACISHKAAKALEWARFNQNRVARYNMVPRHWRGWHVEDALNPLNLVLAHGLWSMLATDDREHARRADGWYAVLGLQWGEHMLRKQRQLG